VLAEDDDEQVYQQTEVLQQHIEVLRNEYEL